MRGHFLRSLPKKTITFVGAAVLTTADQTGPKTMAFGSSAIAGVQSGDLLIVAMSNDLTATLSSITSGWTSDFDDSGFDTTSAVALFHRLSDGSTTFSVTSTGGPDTAPALVMMAFRSASFASFANSAVDTATCPTRSPISGGGVVIVGFAQDSLVAMTAPANYTTNFTQALSSTVSSQSVVGMGYRLGISGSQSPGSFGGVGGAANFMRCTSIALD